MTCFAETYGRRVSGDVPPDTQPSSSICQGQDYPTFGMVSSLTVGADLWDVAVEQYDYATTNYTQLDSKTAFC